MAEAWHHVGIVPVSCLLLSGRLLYAASRPEVAHMADNSTLPPSICSGGGLFVCGSSTPCRMERVGRGMAACRHGSGVMVACASSPHAGREGTKKAPLSQVTPFNKKKS